MLYACLRVVKVAFYGAHGKVAALLGAHLALLHLAYAVARVKNHYMRTRYVPEAFERRFAGVARSSRQDKRFPAGGYLF